MNRIKKVLQSKPSHILSVYFCAGSTQLDDTCNILLALQEGGIDFCEIGIPFSDPIADGPVIQEASTRALRNGMSLDILFKQLENVRQKISIPLLLMGYFNVIYQYGFERFCQSCARVGIDGMIIPDLPFEEYSKEYKSITEQYGLSFIMLITPETEETRIRAIDAVTDGFIYEVSTNATTGTQEGYGADTLAYFKRTAAMEVKNPLMVGFGVSNQSTFKAASEHAAGAIVGSLFVQLLQEGPTPHVATKKLKQILDL